VPFLIPVEEEHTSLLSQKLITVHKVFPQNVEMYLNRKQCSNSIIRSGALKHRILQQNKAQR
jgi:hypothetical protein